MCGSGRLGSSHHVWRDNAPYARGMVREFRGKFSETLTMPVLTHELGDNPARVDPQRVLGRRL